MSMNIYVGPKMAPWQTPTEVTDRVLTECRGGSFIEQDLSALDLLEAWVLETSVEPLAGKDAVPDRAASGERQDDQGAGRRLARVRAPSWWGSAPGDTRMKGDTMTAFQMGDLSEAEADSATGMVHERTCGEEFAADLVATDTFVVEIFDSLCGYVGMDIYRWGRPESGMWVQGQVRPRSNDSERQAWLRSTYADRAYIDQLNAAVRPLATSRIWEQAEKDMRKQLLKAYGMEGLV